jgi:hypothetical protein
MLFYKVCSFIYFTFHWSYADVELVMYTFSIINKASVHKLCLIVVPQDSCHFYWYTQVSHPVLPHSPLSSMLQICLIVYLLWLDQALQMAPPNKKKSKGHKSGYLGGHSHDPLLPIQWPGTCWPNQSHTSTAWSSSTLWFQVNVTLCINIYTLCWNSNFILVMSLLKNCGLG